MKQATPNVKFGSSFRVNSNEKNGAPGPGTYDAKNIIGADGPSKSISFKPSIEIMEKER